MQLLVHLPSETALIEQYVSIDVCEELLYNDVMNLLREGNRDEAAWREAWGGASSDRQDLCQSVFFD